MGDSTPSKGRYLATAALAVWALIIVAAAVIGLRLMLAALIAFALVTILAAALSGGYPTTRKGVLAAATALSAAVFFHTVALEPWLYTSGSETEVVEVRYQKVGGGPWYTGQQEVPKTGTTYMKGAWQDPLAAFLAIAGVFAGGVIVVRGRDKRHLERAS